MLFLTFQLGSDRYAVEAAQVVEVLPLVTVKRTPRAPAGVAGILNYHGRPVPLIDLVELALGKPSRKWMSTRIILVDYIGESGKVHLLGLLAEQVTETMRCAEGDFAVSGVAMTDAPYLGSVATNAAGIVQRIKVKNLVPENVRSQLFCES